MCLAIRSGDYEHSSGCKFCCVHGRHPPLCFLLVVTVLKWEKFRFCFCVAFLWTRTVPGAGVLNVTTEVSANTVNISWSAPPQMLQHGLIATYHLVVQSVDSRLLQNFTYDQNLSDSMTHVTISGLVPHYSYSYRIVAANRAGRGPSVTGTFRTSGGGMVKIAMVTRRVHHNEECAHMLRILCLVFSLCLHFVKEVCHSRRFATVTPFWVDFSWRLQRSGGSVLFSFVGSLEKYFADFRKGRVAAYQFGHAYFAVNVGSCMEIFWKKNRRDCAMARFGAAGYCRSESPQWNRFRIKQWPFFPI